MNTGGKWEEIREGEYFVKGRSYDPRDAKDVSDSEDSCIFPLWEWEQCAGDFFVGRRSTFEVGRQCIGTRKSVGLSIWIL